MSGSPHNKTTSNTRTTEQHPQVESGPVVAKASRPSDPDRSVPSPENDPTSEYNKYGCHHKTLNSCVPQRSRAFLSVRGAEDDAVSPVRGSNTGAVRASNGPGVRRRHWKCKRVVTKPPPRTLMNASPAEKSPY